MPTYRADPGGAPTLLVFAGADDAPARWLRLDGGRVIARGRGAPPADGEARVVLAVPGEAVAIHWLELAGSPTLAQAAAAARLMLADASAEPIAGMHVAVGRAEAGLTPVALVSARRMTAWLAATAAAALEPDALVPTPMLLGPPGTGIVRHGLDHRGQALAFAIEPEPAEALIGDAEVVAIDEAAFEAGLGPLVAAPPLDLRQGPFAKRRAWRERGALRRVAMLALVLALLTLAAPVARLALLHASAARLEAEAALLHRRGAGGADASPGFAWIAPALFAAVRATPNAELARIDYRADGSLTATVLVDTPATLDMLSTRLREGGLEVTSGALASRAGRPAADLMLRAS